MKLKYHRKEQEQDVEVKDGENAKDKEKGMAKFDPFAGKIERYRKYLLKPNTNRHPGTCRNRGETAR